MKRLITGMLAAIVALTMLTPAAQACKGNKDCACDKPVLKVGFLLQPRWDVAENSNATADAWGTDAYLKRARFILAGRVNKLINFFMETDNPNWGKNGDWSSEFYVQDAFIDFQFMDEFKLAAGMILLPFTHHSRQSAASLATLGYQNMFSGKDFGMPGTKVWRDIGFEARGLVTKWFDYRVGVYQGVRGKKCKDIDGMDETACEAYTDYKMLNPDDMPRLTGRLALNIFDAEPGFFYGGTYLGKKKKDGAFQKILTVGAGFDFQPGATLDDAGEAAPYMAFSGDVFADIPLNAKMGVSGQAGFVYYDRGYNQKHAEDITSAAVTGKDLADETMATDATVTINNLNGYLASYAESGGNGMGAYGNLGFRYNKFMPYVGGEWFNSNVDGKDLMNIRGGLMYFIKGHNANIKLDYAYMSKEAELDDGTFEMEGSSAIMLQLQFLILSETLLK